MKLYYTLLFTALPYIIFAQSNYHEGYVVKNNGDTLKGFIDSHEWAQNPRSVNFKIKGSDREALNFSPRTIKAFQVAGSDTYVAYMGPVSTDRNRFPDLPFGLDTSKKADTVFLKQLVKGKYLALFSDQDMVKTRFFVAETNSQPVELKYFQYYDSANQLETKTFYKGQLIFYIHKYMPDNTTLTQDADGVKFDPIDLEKMVLAINGDKSAPKKAAYFRFFFGAGVSSVSSRFQDYGDHIGVFTQVGPVTEVAVNPEAISKSSTTISPRINFGFDVLTNPDVQKLILRAEMSLSYNSPRFDYMVYGGGTSNVAQTYSFDQYTATFIPQLILNLYNKDNFKIYIDGGIGLNFSSYSNISLGSADAFSSVWLNFPVAAGVVINKNLQFSITYALPESLINAFASPYNVNYQFVDFGFKYLFGTTK